MAGWASQLRLRSLLAALCLLTFVAQSLVTATDIHGIGLSASVRTTISVAAVLPISDTGLPADQDDPAHCPFCQAILLAGNAITGAAVMVPVSEFMTHLPRLRGDALHPASRIVGAAHNRGPPRT